MNNLMNPNSRLRILNNDAKEGDIQNYLIIPANFSSLSSGAALKDAQKRDISWSKAEV